jgi:hypothetical protein
MKPTMLEQATNPHHFAGENVNCNLVLLATVVVLM